MPKEQNLLVRTFPLAWSVQDPRFGDYILPEKILRRELGIYRELYVQKKRAVVDVEQRHSYDPRHFQDERNLLFAVDLTRTVGLLTDIEITDEGKLVGTVEFHQPNPEVEPSGFDTHREEIDYKSRTKSFREKIIDLMLIGEKEGTQIFTLRMVGAGSVGEDKILRDDFLLVRFQLGPIHSQHVNEVA